MGILLAQSWLYALFVVYVGFAALAQHPRSLGAWLALVLGPIAVVQVFRRTRVHTLDSPRRTTDQGVALRMGVLGVALTLEARLGQGPAFDAVANLGVGVGVVAALLAVARIATQEGLLKPPKITRSLDAALVAALLWGLAVVVPAWTAAVPWSRLALDPLATGYVTATASFVSLMLMGVSAWRLRQFRRFELGVHERAQGLLVSALAGLLLAIPAPFLDVMSPDRALPLTALGVGVLWTWMAITRDPAAIARALRASILLLGLGGPATLIFITLALRYPHHLFGWMLGTVAFFLALGLLARSLSRPLGPEQSRWLEAIERASIKALMPEPEDARREVLLALQGIAKTPGQSAALYRLEPLLCSRVDIAGNLHEVPAVLPPRLLELAEGEPEHTLRAEVLRAVQVRQPEVRPLLSWMEEQNCFSLTLLREPEGYLGLLSLPKAFRETPLTVEEARALRALGERMAAVVSIAGAHARARARELEARALAERRTQEAQELAERARREAERRFRELEHRALGVRGTTHGTTSRIALDALEGLARQDQSFVLLGEPGLALVPWAALAALEGPRAKEPFVQLTAEECQSSEGCIAVLDRAVQAAGKGTLVLEDAQTLPREARAYLEALVPSEENPVSPETPRLFWLLRTQLSDDEALESLGEPLAGRLRSHTLRIPGLAERAEDLRSILLGRGAHFGLLVQGHPLGIEAQALRELLDYPWPGNDLELEAVFLRLAEASPGERIELPAVRALGLAIPEEEEATYTPLAPETTRRPGRRSTRPRH